MDEKRTATPGRGMTTARKKLKRVRPREYTIASKQKGCQSGAVSKSMVVDQVRSRLTDEDQQILEEVCGVGLEADHPVGDRREDDGRDETEGDDVEQAARKKPGRGRVVGCRSLA